MQRSRPWSWANRTPWKSWQWKSDWKNSNADIIFIFGIRLFFLATHDSSTSCSILSTSRTLPRLDRLLDGRQGVLRSLILRFPSGLGKYTREWQVWVDNQLNSSTWAAPRGADLPVLLYYSLYTHIVILVLRWNASSDRSVRASNCQWSPLFRPFRWMASFRVNFFPMLEFCSTIQNGTLVINTCLYGQG